MNQFSLFEVSRCADTAESFIDDLVAFDDFGKKAVSDERNGIPYFINEMP